ncbi:unnamed protein product [Calypogeia fissa]
MRLSMPSNAGAGTSTDSNGITIKATAVGPFGQRVLPGIGALSKDWNIRRLHVVPTDLPISQLLCREAWMSLTESQRFLLHHFERASWAGARICAHQLSKESPDILRILLLVLSSTSFENLRRETNKAGVRQKEWEFFIAYANCFLTNLGNYLAFGDFKIVPGVSEDKFDGIVKASPLQGERKHRLVTLWEKTRKKIYSLAPGERALGFPPTGKTAYYSEDITEAEVKLVAEWMKQERVEPWNTRIWKRINSGNYGSLPEYDLRIASAHKFPIKTHVFQKKCVIHVVYGDFQEDLEEVVTHLRNALPYASNSVEYERLNCFIEYIETGSVDCHKRCQEIWLSNNQKDNTIEFHLGFIETYHDPSGSRAEFEGFFAAVNKVATEKFDTLIERADVLLPLLPWPKEYEADKFICPTFTCIEVFFYANGTIPAGINLPNYENIRQTHGSRNFCLANVVETHDNHSKTTFLAKHDEELSTITKGDVFFVQLAFHELLGHGSGKLFTQNQGGEYNFSLGSVMHPITHEAVVTCYGPGETWNSTFGQISAAYEECRAECVGIFLSANPQALEVFGHVGQRAEDIMYISWLMMARAGLLALEYFSFESGEWRQAHMQARFAILRTLLSAAKQEAEDSRARGLQTGSIFLEFQPVGLDDVVIHLNRDKIRSVGLPAIRDLLVKLQVYRSTADVKRGRELFTKLTRIPKEMLQFRDALLAQKTPRPMFVQMNTKLVEGENGCQIEMEEFATTTEGLIQSYIAHFRDWIPHC